MSYQFNFTSSIVRSLQTIERVRERVSLTILPPLIAERLRLRAHIRSTHFSTRIEGNRLTLEETEKVLQQGHAVPDKERDVHEVERYYQALQKIETWAEKGLPITEDRLCKLHAILYYGRRSKATPYRDGQNVIRDREGAVVYLPPEASDVPDLMAELVSWIQSSWEELPIPVIAGTAHYQFVTIHPFFDGNGRSARTLATWILYRGDYDLGKFFALEEFYAEDLQGYYNALITHPHHNYYFGRNTADITLWLDYFLSGMAAVFERVAQEVSRSVHTDAETDTAWELLRPLDHRSRRVLGLFSGQETIQSSDVAHLLGISSRQARELLQRWTAEGWLIMADPSRRGRKYRLAEPYRQLL